MLTEGNS